MISIQNYPIALAIKIDIIKEGNQDHLFGYNQHQRPEGNGIEIHVSNCCENVEKQSIKVQ